MSEIDTTIEEIQRMYYVEDVFSSKASLSEALDEIWNKVKSEISEEEIEAEFIKQMASGTDLVSD